MVSSHQRTISLECPRAHCNKETTWQWMYPPALVKGEQTTPDYRLHNITYECVLCHVGSRARRTIFYREMRVERREKATVPGSGLSSSSPQSSTREVVVEVMKVGEYPKPSISIPKGLEETLGADDADLYKKALISRSNGFGLAAVAYMRRVVEDKTRELIEVAAQYAEIHGADAKAIEALKKAANPLDRTTYEEKLKLAAAVFPESLRVGSYNPLQILFDAVSQALHGLSEEQCIEVTDEIKFVFEYVFATLRADVNDRRTFEEKMKKLAK